MAEIKIGIPVDRLGGYATGEAFQILSNSEKGVGHDTTGTPYLVVCCANCGDYSRVRKTLIQQAFRLLARRKK